MWQQSTFSVILPWCEWLLQAAAAGAAAAQAISEFFSGTLLCLFHGHAGGKKVSHAQDPRRTGPRSRGCCRRSHRPSRCAGGAVTASADRQNPHV